MKLLGKKKMDFISNEGKHIVGTKLYLGEITPEVEGYVTSEVFLSADKFDCPYKVGDEIEVYYNNHKQVVKIELVK